MLEFVPISLIFWHLCLIKMITVFDAGTFLGLKKRQHTRCLT